MRRLSNWARTCGNSPFVPRLTPTSAFRLTRVLVVNGAGYRHQWRRRFTLQGLCVCRAKHTSPWPLDGFVGLEPEMHSAAQKMRGDLCDVSAENVKLGFIGLGNMGGRIAQRLLDHGYSLVVYDRDIAKAEAVAAERGFAAKNIPELARTADVILSCLSNDEAVQGVYTGPAGVLATARPETIVLEMSTISPESSRELHRLGAKNGTEGLVYAL